jgi:AraC-like DNA-binding protein
MNYTVHHPDPALAPIVECVWTLEGQAADLGGEPQSILPDGRPEIIVHLGDAFDRVEADGAGIRQDALLVAGQLTSRLLLQPTGRIAVAGVRLRPDGVAALFRQPAGELTGLTIGMDAVARPLFAALAQVRDSTGSIQDAVPAIQRQLARHVDMTGVDPAVRFAVDAIEASAGRLSIEDLAWRVGITRRHLERRFHAVVGLSPKRLARIARLQRAIRMMEALDAPGRGARTAAECGYADQAHFIRDCRDLCGQAPAAWLQRRAELTGFFLSRPDAS